MIKKGLEAVKNASLLKDVKYWYGAKGQLASADLADWLRAEYPSVWTNSYYSKAILDIDGKTRVGDCSYLVCKAYGISMIGSSQMKNKFKVWNDKPKNGMILWRSGHVAIYNNGFCIQLKGVDYDYTELPYGVDKYDIIYYHPDVNYDNYHGWVEEDGKWYYYDNEVRQVGWRCIGTRWYYFHDDGVMHDGWLNIDKKWYYADVEGRFFVSEWLHYKDNWFYFNENGEMAVGPVLCGGNLYLMDKNGKMVTGEYEKDGFIYNFDEQSGAFIALNRKED